MLICIYIYSYNAIRLWYKLYSEPILAYAFPVSLAFADRQGGGKTDSLGWRLAHERMTTTFRATLGSNKAVVSTFLMYRNQSHGKVSTYYRISSHCLVICSCRLRSTDSIPSQK
jgi:hypothetical protein